MLAAPEDIIHRLRRHHQEHVLHGWEGLSAEERAALIQQLAGIDLSQLESLYVRRHEPHTLLPPREVIEPLPVEDAASLTASTRSRGEAALRAGEVAVLLVAGGQGSRLGFDKPKGMFPIGPISRASLFQIHAEKVLALSRKYGRAIPFLIMTSPATHADTVAYFNDHRRFGLGSEQVIFFQQGTMPALDFATGKLLLEKPGQLHLSPNGHGGTLMALSDSGLLADLRAVGVRHIFYFQVDNPLVAIADPAFIGRHLETESEFSSKVIDKERPEEKVGVFARIRGRCGILEYSDMPAEMAAERGADGQLLFRAGNPAIHLFRLDFLERVTSGVDRLGYHLARKKVPYYDLETGKVIQPTTENALKFELFIFDALPLAERTLAIRVGRNDEFAPVKNATGIDSPASCQKLLREQAARWLESARISVPRLADGEVAVPLEISPLFALTAEELAARLPSNFQVTGPTFLG
jgi:UDP-N-acetylglucosamine/UDP-N-acetylgalactosamine diphosphorylase